MRFAAVLTLALLAASTADAEDRTFSAHPLENNQQSDDLIIAGNSHLAAMNEPSLWRSTRKIETYRLLWLRSFHAPMVFRLIIKPDGTSELITKKTSGQGGFEPGTLMTNKATQINKKETETLLEKLAQIKFWELPANEPDSIVLDGSQWIIEGVKDDKYLRVDRRNGGEIRDWALLLMRKSGEDLQPIY